MPIDDDHPLIRHFHQIRYSDQRPDEVLFVVVEREIVAVLEMNERLAIENESLKRHKDISWLRDILEKLTQRVIDLERRQS
jgi:hypothetical protein